MAQHITVPAGARPVFSKRERAGRTARNFEGYVYPDGHPKSGVLFLRDHRDGTPSQCDLREVTPEAYQDSSLVQNLAAANGWTLAFTREWLQRLTADAADTERRILNLTSGPVCPDLTENAHVGDRSSGPSQG